MADPDLRREITIAADNFEVSVGDDDAHRGVKLGIDGEPFWRVWLTPQGEILTGNGMVPPTTYAGGGGGSGDVATDAIWDAAGDLAVGSGANTAARLAKGADGTVLSVVAGALAWATPSGAPSGAAGGVLGGTYPNPSFAVDMATQSELDAETTARGVAIAALSAVYQPLHANLTAFAGLSLVADRLPYANGTGTLALATFTAAGRALVDDADAPAQRSTLGLGTLATQSWPLANTGATAATDAMTLDVTGDTQKRLVINQDGSMEWGSGAAVADAILSRSATRTLGLAGNLAVTIQNAADTGLLVKGASSQSGNYVEVKNSSDVMQAKISSSGVFWVKNASSFNTRNQGDTVDIVMLTVTSGNNAQFFPSMAAVNWCEFGAGNVVVNGFGQVGIGGGQIGNTNAKLSVFSASTSQIGMYVRGFAGQTAALQEWRDSSNGVLASVSAAGLGLFTGLSITDATNIALGTTTGTKIGTGTTQKLGFYNATPIVQGASIADPSGGSVVDSEARTALISVISRLEALGLIATV